jgi:hypothetical protein
VSEQGKQRQDRHQLKLEMTGSVGDALGQGMEPEIKASDHQHQYDEEGDRADEQNICLPGSRYERRDIVWCERVHHL